MAVNITTETSFDTKGRPVISYHCPEKRVEPLKIRKSQDGFQFIEVASDSGNVPAELVGRFTSENLLDRKIRHYLSHCKETSSAKREYFNKTRQERKAKQASKKE